MTAEGRFLIRTWRDKTRRRYLHERGVNIPLAEHLPPIDQRGADLWRVIEAKRERRRYAEQWAEQLEVLAA